MNSERLRGHVAGLPTWDRCAVMGVVNVTPDSFSDGGRWFDTTASVKHGLHLVTEGADLVDVGGESTRPGATRVDEAEELKRVIPVVRGLASEGVTVSVDTMRASVAEQSLAAGAALVNDVSGGLADPAMIPTVAAAGAPFVVMHWRGFLEGGNVGNVRGRRLRSRRRTARTCGGRSGRRHRPRPRRRRPGPRLLQGLRARPLAPRPPRPAARTRPPPARRRLPQAVPGPRTGGPGGRPRRRPANGTPPPPPSPRSPPTRVPGRSASTRYGPPPTPYESPGP